MNTLDSRRNPTARSTASTLRAAALISALTLLACSPRASDSKVTEAERHGSENSESAMGSGHLHLTGDLTTDADFVVDGCQIGKPGDGLLDGYHMSADHETKGIIQLAVVQKDYAKDGAYTADTSGAAQLKAGMSTGSFSPLSLMLTGEDATAPLAFMLTPGASLVITYSDNGAKGEAKIVDMESQVGMAEMIAARDKGKPHGKKVSGSVTWSCGHVDRLNGEMNKAVDGMMNKLMPNH